MLNHWTNPRLARVAALGVCLGCSAAETPTNGGSTSLTAGSAGVAAVAGAAGTTSTGGSGGSEGSSGPSAGSTAVTAGMAGASGGTAGATNGGTAGAMAGEGGASAAAGAGGTSGSAGTGGAGHQPVASTGCGEPNPPSGARTLTTGGQEASFNVHVPESYDGTTPMPLGFGFHGFGNDECGPEQGECRGFAELPAVTIYMKSISDGWEQSEVLEQNITFFQDVLALVKSEYCIDESRVFVAGVSSGGQFIEHLTCRFGDTFWQVTPVAASVVGAAQDNCNGTPPVLVIHGVTDQAGDYGEGVAEMFAARNGCSETPPAGLEQAKSDLMEAFNQEQAEHVCLDWDGCTLNPVRFCLSSQITYDGLTHGWPMIGGELIGDFQSMLE